nr:MFS transporter [Micromonospora sp. DSM 115978]
ASAANLQARYAATDLAPRGKVARSLAIVVWASTIGTVLGPNLAGPADRLGTALALPELTGPFAFSVVSLAAASAIMAFLPRPAAPAATGTPGTPGTPAPAPQLRVAARAAFANPVTRTALVVVAASH